METVIRVKHDENNPYVVMNKVFLGVQKMSLRAKGLLAYLLSLPSDWTIYENQLSRALGTSEGIIGKTLQELNKFGYCKRTYKRDDNGRLAGYEYTIYETAQEEPLEYVIPGKKTPTWEKLTSVKPALLNKDYSLRNEVVVGPSEKQDMTDEERFIRDYCAYANVSPSKSDITYVRDNWPRLKPLWPVLNRVMDVWNDMSNKDSVKVKRLAAFVKYGVLDHFYEKLEDWYQMEKMLTKPTEKLKLYGSIVGR